MSKSPRTPSHPPTPASKEPRDRRAQKPGAPGVSFYASSVGEVGRQKLIEARKVEGIDEELALLRQRLDRLIAVNPDDHGLILKSLDIIVRAYAAKIRAQGNSQEPDDTAIIDMLREATDTLGLKRVPWREC